MNKEKMLAYYNGLPTYAKGIIAIAAVGAVVAVGYQVYIKVFPSKSDKAAQDYLNAIVNDIQRFKNEGQVASYPEAAYVTFANTIYNGMRYVIGDDYGGVVETCKKMQNSLDVALLIDAFGVRQNYMMFFDAGDPMDMFTFIRSELGNEYLGITAYRLKQINQDWDSKGITYKI
jgi:hypothetical protein